jgi:hypothetical protein
MPWWDGHGGSALTETSGRIVRQLARFSGEDYFSDYPPNWQIGYFFQGKL